MKKMEQVKKLGSTKQAIVNFVSKSYPVSVHEIKTGLRKSKVWCSENAIATRISELSADGFITGRRRIGKQYKEWLPCKNKKRKSS